MKEQRTCGFEPRFGASTLRRGVNVSRKAVPLLGATLYWSKIGLLGNRNWQVGCAREYAEEGCLIGVPTQ